MLLWVHFCRYTLVDTRLILPFNCLILPFPLYTFLSTLFVYPLLLTTSVSHQTVTTFFLPHKLTL